MMRLRSVDYADDTPMPAHAGTRELAIDLRAGCMFTRQRRESTTMQKRRILVEWFAVPGVLMKCNNTKCNKEITEADVVDDADGCPARFWCVHCGMEWPKPMDKR